MKLFLLCVLLAFTTMAADLKLLIGTHDEAGSEGAYTAVFDAETGKLSDLKLLSERPGTVIVRSSATGLVYTAGGAEEVGYLKSYKDGKKTGEIKGFPNQPCYVSLDKTAKYVFTANIRGDSVSSFSLKEDGSLNKHIQDLKIEPSTKSFRPHCIIISPDNKFLFIADIAGRRICRVKFNVNDGSMKHDGDVSSKNFIGPRHFIFAPLGKYAYLMNQMGGAVTVFKYHSENGELEEIQHISALPKDFGGKNHSAEILIHPGGKFLYCSNRGPDSLTLFKRDTETGLLEFKKCVSSGGQAPWSFTLSPKGKYLLCSNKSTANIVVYEIDGNNGELKQTKNGLKVPAPVSLDFIAN